MTRQRSFKRLVRARMAKTGESYTAARARILAATEEPSPTDESVLVVPDDTIRFRTGRGWEDWFDLIDSWGADQLTHRDIARRVAGELGIDPLAWNAQAITVSFERARGRRALGQRADGFAATASKTVAVPVEDLFEAFVEPARRPAWLDDDRLAERSATPPKAARFDWGDDGTRVHVTWQDKGDSKSAISLEHMRLPDADAAAEMKDHWRRSLARLKTYLEEGRDDA